MFISVNRLTVLLTILCLSPVTLSEAACGAVYEARVRQSSQSAASRCHDGEQTAAQVCHTRLIQGRLSPSH